MSMLILILLIAGLLCFLAVAIRYKTRFDIMAVGLACWIATAILSRL